MIVILDQTKRHRQSVTLLLTGRQENSLLEEDKIQSSQQFEEKKETNNSDQVLAPQEPAQRPIQSVLPLEHSQQQAKSENESGQDINLVDTGREHTANKKDADDERSQLSQKSEETMQPNTSEQVQLSFEKETFQSPQQFEEQNEPNNSDQRKSGQFKESEQKQKQGKDGDLWNSLMNVKLGTHASILETPIGDSILLVCDNVDER
ncbi:unnamed protein product [Mytilus coruscus]|uniref:Uncharacterized protein n=1 Tax=Mytilus coruscus TaxID=42192 RepID=A0A6J8DP05_MYTCO|nr:unnamed protein product [Mytilus coruscus]